MIIWAQKVPNVSIIRLWIRGENIRKKQLTVGDS